MEAWDLSMQEEHCICEPINNDDDDDNSDEESINVEGNKILNNYLSERKEMNKKFNDVDVKYHGL